MIDPRKVYQIIVKDQREQRERIKMSKQELEKRIEEAMFNLYGVYAYGYCY